MFKWIHKIFFKVKMLEKENEELRNKLEERQKTINKTNAYWKRRVHEITRQGNK